MGSIKVEMAYLALRNFFVELQDDKRAEGSEMAKEISGQVLDIIDAFENKFSFSEGLTLLLMAAERITLNDTPHMSKEMEKEFDIAVTRGQTALKQS